MTDKTLLTELRERLADIVNMDGKTTMEDFRASGEKLMTEWQVDQILSLVLEKMAREVWKTLKNIRRFDDKENGANYFSGWDGALDIVEMDFKYLFSKEEV